jgi:hypothetical protein
MELETAASVYRQITMPALGIGAMAALLAVMLPAAAVLGFVSGRWNRARRLAQGREVDPQLGEASLGAILALLGLLLAFSFGSALSQLETRKADVILEANAIGTAFLRADYLSEPGRGDLQRALHEYALTRLVPDGARLATRDDAREFIDRSLQAQARLWPITLDATAPPLPAPLATFVAGSVNDVIDAHQLRLRSLSAPVAELAQSIVVMAALTALFVLGNRSGVAGRALTWRSFVFSALLYIVMMTVIDVQRGAQGLIRVDQSALAATILDIESRLR